MRTLYGIKNGPELKGRLSRIICPTLVVWGENDKMISANYANEYDEISNNKLEIIENCGHTPFAENPTKFHKAVLQFLRRVHKQYLHQCDICNVIFECNDIIDHRPRQRQDEKEVEKIEDAYDKFRASMCKNCEKSQHLQKEQEWLFEAIKDPLKWRLKYWWLWW